jgi:hypothetical protein
MLLCLEDSGLLHRIPYNHVPLTPVMGHEFPKTAIARPQLCALQNGNVIAFSTGSQVTLLHGPSLAKEKELLRSGPLVSDRLVNLMSIAGNAADNHLCILGLASGCCIDLFRVSETVFTSFAGPTWRQRIVPHPHVVVRHFCLHVCEMELENNMDWHFFLFVELMDGKVMCMRIDPNGVLILWQVSLLTITARRPVHTLGVVEPARVFSAVDL